MEIVELGKTYKINGKAGNLNKLYKDFNIARGFIITNDFFNEFLRLNNISLDNDNLTIQQEIMNGIFLNEKKLLKYYKEQKYNKVIVRSSASLEDGNKYSFAGQFESYTNTDINSLILNIKKCWASSFNDNVKDYILKNKISNNYEFNILVQEMIISDISGIAFSINPTNGKQEILINVTDSQCEELVSGKVIPHTYHISDKLCEDKFIEKDKLIIIKENLQKLKKIFKKDIEIEFCFKDEKFYLFQVRPITKIYFSLNDYINNEFWCSFKNNNWTLFNRSLWILGATKYKNKVINNNITEDITIYYPYNERQIRAFNGNQPPLDKQTIDNHSVTDINKYINKYDKVVMNIKEISPIIKDNISKNNFEDFKKNLKKLIRYNAIINSYEYLIGSLGQALHQNLDKDTKKNIEKWRNSEDNSYFPVYDSIFKYILEYFNINLDVKKFRMYIPVNELLNLCAGKIDKSNLLKRITKREKNGFVLLNLQNKKFNNKVVTNKSTFNTVKNRFYDIQNNIIKENRHDGIKGHSTFKNGEIITGECLVIKNNISPEMDLDNKILICEVTTAKDVKFLKNIKALIVNNGGVLCHSAIFSREFNIPCLMGCEVATNYFNTGDIVTFDVDNEIIKKVNKL